MLIGIFLIIIGSINILRNLIGDMKYILLISLLFLSGCDDSSSKHQEILVYHLVIGQVKEVTLSDGTKCAILQVSNGGGISCNWK